MACYEYVCAGDGVAELNAPIGTAPTTIDCPECGDEIGRYYRPPTQGRRSAVGAMIDACAESAERPRVVSAPPPRPAAPQAPPRPALDPRLSRLPRP